MLIALYSFSSNHPIATEVTMLMIFAASIPSLAPGELTTAFHKNQATLLMHNFSMYCDWLTQVADNLMK